MSTRVHVPPRVAALARPVAVAVAGLLVVAPVVVGVLSGSQGAVCGPGGQSLDGLGGPPVCVHTDQAPPGVDVTEHVPTAELQERDGAGLAAYRAAQDLGVPMAAASNAVTPSVPCDGDGTDGFRVQAMYVVEAGHANRFASLLPSFKLWAAGVDDVVNRSAALTGGVRDVRYVTEAGSGSTCEAKVVNLTVPNGSTSSFNATINAVRAMGYDDPSRKYLMWTDANIECGIATLYGDDNHAQGNLNNGSYAQYARIDSGCWGFGNGSGEHSVEAHELVHTLGAVNRSAAHSTANGHCWDENDTMCYADGGGHAMVQVCPAEREYLLDCNTDDYFSTFPDPGGYLETHWNAADSRFLIGGGDGSGGGAAGVPVRLGARIAVNNPVVPGLTTQVEVTPVLPPGRTAQSVSWKAARADCVFSDPTALQSTVGCPAAATGSTTVTATLVDSTGATKSVTSPLQFSTGTARPVAITTVVDGQDGGTAAVCTSASFPLRATVTDVATGAPIRGLAVSFTKQTAIMTASATAGSGITLASGAATGSSSAALATSYAARTVKGAVYAAGASTTVAATPGTCTVDLTASAGAEEIYYGDSVTLSGTLSRSVAGHSLPVVGASVPLSVGWADGSVARSLSLGTAKTTADGSWSAVVKPTHGGTLRASLTGSTAWNAATAVAGTLVVDQPLSDLTAAVDRTDVGYGGTVRVTGALTRVAGGTTTGVKGASLGIKVLRDGATTPTSVGTVSTLADGTYALNVPLKVSGTLSVAYAGTAAQPADSVVLGAVTAGTWTPAITVSGSQVRSSTGVVTETLAGSVKRTYAGATVVAPSLSVQVWFAPTTTGVATKVASGTTNASGAFSVKHSPKVAGSYTVRVVGVPGYADTTSSAVAVTLG
jgi:hypothetical protein